MAKILITRSSYNFNWNWNYTSVSNQKKLKLGSYSLKKLKNKVKVVAQFKPGDSVELRLNQRCAKLHLKGYTQPKQRKQSKKLRTSNL